jgi:hypothetical protein
MDKKEKKNFIMERLFFHNQQGFYGYPEIFKKLKSLIPTRVREL